MKTHLPHLALCSAAAIALAIGACGSDDSEGRKLPRSVSQELRVEIDNIEARVAVNVAGACDDIFNGVDGGNFDEVGATLSEIPDNVDPDIRAALSDSVDRLQQLVDSECDAIQAQEEEPEETVPDETVTEEETVPEETETTPPETETTPPQTETTPPADSDPPTDGNGQGNGPDGTGPPGQDNGGGIEAPDGQ